MKTRHKRLALIVTGVAALTAATLFTLNAFQRNIVFFFSPTEVVEGKAPADRLLRIGGLVEAGSVKRSPDGIKVEFVVTDLKHRIPVYYEGLLPDLFREGGRFMAREVLAKHDEKYMPPEAAKALEGGSFIPGDRTRP
jgi:cytochrome c-type biogenesis protein CcmE